MNIQHRFYRLANRDAQLPRRFYYDAQCLAELFPALSPNAARASRAALASAAETSARRPPKLKPLPEGKPPAQYGRDRVIARITAATDSLSLVELDLAACLIECVLAHPPSSRGRVRQTGAATE